MGEPIVRWFKTYSSFTGRHLVSRYQALNGQFGAILLSCGVGTLV